MEKPIYWNSGLLLQPQHFQLNDLYFQSLLTPVINYGNNYLWGVGELDIRENALNNYIFNIRKGIFWFPLGNYVSYPSNAFVDQRSFKKILDNHQDKSIVVYIGLKRFDEHGCNVTHVPSLNDISSVQTRFVTTDVSESICDLYGNGPDASINKLYYVLKLFFGNEVEQANNYEILPIAHLERAKGVAIVSDSFSPPCFNLLDSESLLYILQDIYDEMNAVCSVLESYKKVDIINTNFNSRDMNAFLVLTMLNGYRPLISQYLKSNQIHPYTVFMHLIQMIGQLSSFSTTFTDDIGPFISYDHNNLWHCFSNAKEKIKQYFSDIITMPLYTFHLPYVERYFYTKNISSEIFHNQKYSYYLRIACDKTAEKIIASIKKSAKLCASKSVAMVRSKGYDGIELSHLDHLPKELSHSPKSVYFQINHRNKLWDDVKSNKDLALLWESVSKDLGVKPEQITIKLIVAENR